MRCVEILPVWIMNEDWSTSRDFCMQLNWFFTNQSQTECGGWIPRIEKHIIHIHGCPAFLWQGLEKDFPAEDVKGVIGRILVKWIQAFLTREPQFQIMLVKIYATILEGIFQSSCSSCTLFLIFISDSTKYLSVSKLQVQINFFFSTWVINKFQHHDRRQAQQNTLNNLCMLWASSHATTKEHRQM